MSSRDEMVRSVAQEIERYLAQHPDAADNAEGIRRWWLWPGAREESEETVQAALDLLEERGVVVKTKWEGAGVIYSGARSGRNRSQ